MQQQEQKCNKMIMSNVKWTRYCKTNCEVYERNIYKYEQ